MKRRRVLLLTTLPLLAAVPAVHGQAAPARTTQPPPLVATRPPDSDVSVLEAALLQAAPTLRPEALRAALAAWGTLYLRGEVSRPILTVIDYGLPSLAKRMWVFDLASRRLLLHELVAHGRNSGEDLASSFSNDEGSLMTSLGAFVTGTTYNGRNGYSLRLRGTEPGLNDRAETRTIVIHGAPYVNEKTAAVLGHLGRSHGCPAVRPAVARPLIDTIKNLTLVYAWHPSIGTKSAPADPALLVAIQALAHGKLKA